MSALIDVAPPPRTVTWLGASMLILTDIVGTSVLTFAGVARKLGWVPTILVIVGCCPVCVYTGTLMSRTRSALVNASMPEPLTMGEAARLCAGGEKAANVVYALVYGFAFFGNASYLLVLGQCFQGMFPEAPMCLWHAVFYACICCMPVVVSVRNLKDSVWLCNINFLVILGTLGIVLLQLVSNGRIEDSKTFYVAEDLTLATAFGSFTNVMYSYTGHWLYFEMMAEMRTPTEFPRALLINAPIQVALYLVVACTGYYCAGDKAKDYFLDNLPNGSFSHKLASSLLFAHVLVAYLIKNVVLARYMHGLVSPWRAREESRRAHAEHAACAVVLTVLGFLTASAVPFFSDFLGLIGGLLCGPTCFVMPLVFFVGSEMRKHASIGWIPGGGTRVSDLGASLCRESDEPAVTPTAANAAITKENKCLRSLQLSLPDAFSFIVVAALTLLTMTVGTFDVLRDIFRRTEAYGPPFSCD